MVLHHTPAHDLNREIGIGGSIYRGHDLPHPVSAQSHDGNHIFGGSLTPIH